MDKYTQYIASDKWAKKRQEVLERDKHQCQTCLHDGTHYRLEVHHKTYVHLGNEPLEDLITLCSSCHEAITAVIQSRRYATQSIPKQCMEEQLPKRYETQQDTEDTMPTGNDYLQSDYRKRSHNGISEDQHENQRSISFDYAQWTDQRPTKRFQQEN